MKSKSTTVIEFMLMSLGNFTEFLIEIWVISMDRPDRTVASMSSFQQSPEVFYKKGVLRNFAKFTEKHLCQSLFLIKFQ